MSNNLLVITSIEIIVLLVFLLSLARFPRGVSLCALVTAILCGITLETTLALIPGNSVNVTKAMVGKEFMRAVVCDPAHEDYGLKFVDDMKIPSHNQNEALIKVRTAGINPVDYKFNLAALPFVRHLDEYIAGNDFAGEIVSIGKDDSCKDFKIHDKVYGFGHGTFAEYATASCNQFAHKPKNMKSDDLGAIPIVSLTSLEAFNKAGIKKDDPANKNKKVLIVGGSSGTGTFGLKIAKAYGIGQIYSINSGKNDKLVKGFGATETVDYTKDKELKAFIDKNKGTFDFIYDTVSSADERDPFYHPMLQGLLKKDHHAKYLAINGSVSDMVKMGASMLLQKISKGLTLFPVKYEVFLLKGDRTLIEQLNDLYESGGLDSHVQIDEVFKLDSDANVQKALKKLDSRHATGKLVFKL